MRMDRTTTIRRNGDIAVERGHLHLLGNRIAEIFPPLPVEIVQGRGAEGADAGELAGGDAFPIRKRAEATHRLVAGLHDQKEGPQSVPISQHSALHALPTLTDPPCSW